jgi:outer membrane protein OmpA-like peptidoglycan-associated protein
MQIYQQRLIRMMILLKLVRKGHKLFLYYGNVSFKLSSYKLDKAAIFQLNQVAKVLNQNPELVIEIGVHVDVRSGLELTKELTEKRALAIRGFLITKGVKADNLIAKGYGCTEIINKCKDIVKCTEAEHRVNRRVELKIINPEKLGKYIFIKSKSKVVSKQKID